VLYPLVLDLPRGPQYRIILLDRNLDEVLDSQAAMLGRGQQFAGDRAALRDAWTIKLGAAWESLSKRGDCQLLRIEHRELVAGNSTTYQQLLDFLGAPATPEALRAVIRPELYRSRS